MSKSALVDVLAIGEQVHGYSGTLWVGLFGVRGVSPEIEAKLQDAMKKVLMFMEQQILQGQHSSHGRGQSSFGKHIDEACQFIKAVSLFPRQSSLS